MNQIQSIPLGLDQHEEKKIWRMGLTCGMCDDGTPVAFWEDEAAASFNRDLCLRTGDYWVVSDVHSLTITEANAIAKAERASEVQVLDIFENVVERWLP